MVESPEPKAPAPGGPDLDDPQQLHDAVREVSLRLLAGAVSRGTMKELQKLLRENVGDFPWREVVRRVLAEPVDAHQLVEKGLAAQRDWVWRGGRETPGPSLSRRTKGFVAKLCAQAVFLAIWAFVVVLALLVLKHGWPAFDIYGVLDWLYGVFPSLRR